MDIRDFTELNRFFLILAKIFLSPVTLKKKTIKTKLRPPGQKGLTWSLLLRPPKRQNCSQFLSHYSTSPHSNTPILHPQPRLTLLNLALKLKKLESASARYNLPHFYFLFFNLVVYVYTLIV